MVVITKVSTRQSEKRCGLVLSATNVVMQPRLNPWTSHKAQLIGNALWHDKSISAMSTNVENKYISRNAVRFIVFFMNAATSVFYELANSSMQQTST